MINDKIFFAESLLIPSSYRAIFKQIHGNLTSPDYTVICKSYKDRLDASLHTDVPSLRDFSEYNESDFIRNVIFLKQAYNFEKLSANAASEVKPLLLYYAENQLYAFFVYSLFYFDNFSKGHGLSIVGNTYDNIGVSIKKNGFFQRIVNTYTVLGSSWVFSPLKLNSSNSFDELDGEYSFVKEPTIPLKKLIKIKNNFKPNPDGYITDQLDYLFLFIASSLARYKPDLWHSIVAGENGDEIAYFKQSFTRFNIVWKRLLHTLFSQYHNTGEYTLHSFDIEMNESYTVG